MNEIERWCPSLKAVRLHGSKPERKEQIERFKAQAANVCCTTYEVALAEKGFLQRQQWEYLVIDEAHRIKNENSQLSQALARLRVACVALSGHTEWGAVAGGAAVPHEVPTAHHGHATAEQPPRAVGFIKFFAA